MLNPAARPKEIDLTLLDAGRQAGGVHPRAEAGSQVKMHGVYALDGDTARALAPDPDARPQALDDPDAPTDPDPGKKWTAVVLRPA